jgi:hypothetical protein
MKYSGYSSNANRDDKSVGLLKRILAKHGRVMTDALKSGDKYPNIDGFLEVVLACKWSLLVGIYSILKRANGKHYQSF